MDVVTFTISLPTAAAMPAYVQALRNAKASLAAQGNPAAAQAISAVLVLAQRGLVEFQAAETQHTFPTR